MSHPTAILSQFKQYCCVRSVSVYVLFETVQHSDNSSNNYTIYRAPLAERRRCWEDSHTARRKKTALKITMI